jgi:penicillin G amidase
VNIARLALRLALGRRLPITTGSLNLDGLDGEVVIARDGWGIPHITASSDHDAWFGLGFCHAQDRAFQLETVRRVAHGTLSEIVGPDGLPVDRMTRRLGFLRYARAQVKALDSDVLGVMQAYAAGVNSGLTQGSKRRAHEFALLRTQPSQWEAVDVLAVAKLLSFAMSGNWDAELARFRVLIEDGPDALAHIDPEYAAWHPVTAAPGAVAGPQLDRLSGEIAALMKALGMSGGSNAWAVAPAKTASGRPILANDPHLPPRLPSPWYLARLNTREWAMTGATFVGVPIFPSGHNGHVAWGTTLGLADTTDLYVEGPFHGGTGEDAEKPTTLREEIRVKGKPTEVEEVTITPRGPLLTPLINGGGYSLSIRAMWMQPRPIHGFLRVARTRTVAEFREAFEAWPLMSLNLVFADDSGAIGWQLVGETPVRRRGHGIVPMAASSEDSNWANAPVPYEDMPGAADPPQGYFVSANNRPVPERPEGPEAGAPFLSVDWADGLRAARVGQQLSGSDTWSVAETARLQMDLYAVQWEEVREAVLAIQALDSASRDALALLADWDGVMHAGSGAAAVFELLMAEIDRRDVEAWAPKAGAYVLGADIGGLGQPNLLAFRRAGRLSRLLREGQPKAPEQRATGDWASLLSEALQGVAETLSARASDDAGSWRWGKLRQLVLEHPVGEKWPLHKVFNIGPVPFGGDTNTVAQAAVDPLHPLANPLIIPSLRCVMDVGDFDRSTFVLPSGQSGNPLSPHYGDMFPLWLDGKGVGIADLAAGAQGIGVRKLRLTPRSYTTVAHR